MLAIIFLFSCSKSPNNSTPPTKSDGLLPLSVGNFWQYIKTSYDSTGAIIGTSTDEIDITGQITVSGVTYYQQTQASITNINSASFFINLDSNTLEKIDSATQYTFFKRVTVDSSSVDIWADTVTSIAKVITIYMDLQIRRILMVTFLCEILFTYWIAPVIFLKNGFTI